jgi:sugar lactone lactonase YvrE
MTLTVLVAASVVVGARLRPIRFSPRIERIEPPSAGIAGGATVTIVGANFPRSLAGVTFGGVSATSIEVLSATSIRVVIPPHQGGFTEVRVTTRAAGEAVSSFLYTPPSLSVIGRGDITTVAGIGLYLGQGALARDVPFEPSDVSVDPAGNVFVGEGSRNIVRQITRDGRSLRFAGRGTTVPPGSIDDIGNGVPARDAYIAYPMGVGAHGLAEVHIADVFNHRVRRVDRTTGIITTVAGSGPVNYHGAFSGDGGPATEARLDQPNQVTFDAAGNIYMLDAVNYRIRKVDPAGVITTAAGNGTRGFGGDGGPATAAAIDIGPNGDTGSLESDAAGNLYLADVGNGRVRRIDAATGVITTIAGGGTRTDEGAPATESSISVRGIALGPDGSVYVSDFSRIRQVAPDGRIITLFGTATPGFSEDGAAPDAGQLVSVDRMELDAARNRLVFCELGTGRVRALDLASRLVTTLGGIGPAALGENGPAVAAQLDALVTQLALTANDELLITGYTRLRRLESDGTLRTIAGGGIIPDGPPPPVRPALGVPLDSFGVAVAPDGGVYVTGPYEVGRITSDGQYERVAGGAYGYSGDGGPASEATFDNPGGLAIDGAGNIFVGDSWNHCIRRIDAATGIITTYAGKFPPHPPNILIENPSSGDGGKAVDAQLSYPQFMAHDVSGNLYVTDTGRVRRIDRATGTIDAVPGVDEHNCSAGPLAADTKGRVYVRCFDGTILRINAPASATPIGGTTSDFGFSGDGGPASAAQARGVYGMAIDRQGNVYLNDVENRRIRVIKGIASP